MGKTTYEIFINKGYFWNQLKVEKGFEKRAKLKNKVQTGAKSVIPPESLLKTKPRELTGLSRGFLIIGKT